MKKTRKNAQELSDGVPIACTLSDPEFRRREATLLARFKSAVIATEEVPDGYAFRMPGNNKWVALISELIAAERACCPFLTFELAATPNMGPLILRITGPAGTKDFLRTTFCNSQKSA